MQAAAVDPGGSFTNIYRDSWLFSRGPLRWGMHFLYSPPEQGACAIVHACTGLLSMLCMNDHQPTCPMRDTIGC